MMFGKNPGSDKTYERIPQGSIGVELGVWKGDTSEKFLKRSGVLHLVDSWSVSPYIESEEFGDYQRYLKRYSLLVGSENPKDFQKFYDDIASNVKKRFEGKPVVIHRMTTTKFFDSFSGKVDWVYVDASHVFKGCLSDLHNSYNIIKPGGAIMGDDYGTKKGVGQAVDKFIGDTGLELNNFYLDQYEIRIP